MKLSYHTRKLVGRHKAIFTTYRFLYPQHFQYLLSQGMGIKWMPEWFIFGVEAQYRKAWT